MRVWPDSGFCDRAGRRVQRSSVYSRSTPIKPSLMKICDKLKRWVRRQRFKPTTLGAIINPFYIIRRGLVESISKLAPSISGNILDFGCGSKPYESLFVNASTYIGVDLKITGHDHSDSKIDVLYDGQILPFRDRQFDAVVSFEVLEHVFNLTEVLNEMHRVTKNSGHLIISIPFAWHEHEQPYDFARYTSFGIGSVLAAVGYQIIDIKKSTTHVLATFQMFIAYLTLCSPQNRILRYLPQVCFIFPLTVAAYIFNALLPKKYEYFCNTVLLATKRQSLLLAPRE